MLFRVCASIVFALLAVVPPAQAQNQSPAPPPNKWKLAFGAGLSFTSGNADTSTYNASYAATYTASARNLFKSDAMFMRGHTEGELSTDRFGLNIREESRLSDRVFVFGQNQYLRDRFKRIQYLVAPTGGVGVTTVRTERTTMTIDVGAGGVWEKNPFDDVRASGALTFTQKLSQTISTTTTVTQSIFGLWKTQDLSDSYYQFGVALATAVASRTQLKVEFLDNYNRRPTGMGVQKNDVSLVIALVFKN